MEVLESAAASDGPRSTVFAPKKIAYKIFSLAGGTDLPTLPHMVIAYRWAPLGRNKIFTDEVLVFYEGQACDQPTCVRTRPARP